MFFRQVDVLLFDRLEEFLDSSSKTLTSTRRWA